MKIENDDSLTLHNIDIADRSMRPITVHSSLIEPLIENQVDGFTDEARIAAWYAHQAGYTVRFANPGGIEELSDKQISRMAPIKEEE